MSPADIDFLDWGCGEGDAEVRWKLGTKAIASTFKALDHSHPGMSLTSAQLAVVSDLGNSIDLRGFTNR